MFHRLKIHFSPCNARSFLVSKLDQETLADLFLEEVSYFDDPLKVSLETPAGLTQVFYSKP